MRGKPGGEVYDALTNRITPACAGKTFESICSLFGNEDHPRVCGENSGLVAMPDGKTGSPPRVRGKQAKQVCEQLAMRITPACAGKTLAEPVGHQLREDHPRVCGENPL